MRSRFPRSRSGISVAASLTVALAVATFGVSPAGAAGPTAASQATTAAASEQVSVDLAQSTGAFRGGASGALYGLYDEGVPSNNLIQGMGLQSVDTKAQDGQQHPGSDALEVAKPFLASGGKDVYIYMTDVYRNFPYERTSYAQYQGYLKPEVEQVLSSPYRDHVVLIPYNEPDGNWFGGMDNDQAKLTAFENEWLQTYRFIKGLWPQARIAGPNLTFYYAFAFNGFLSFCKANGCLPDVITWHELGVPSTVRTNVAAYRALETQLGISSLPINLNEYAFRYQLTNPAQMVPYLSALEDNKVDGDLAYWNVNGSLGDSAAQQNVPNGQWWLYNWYSQLTGNTVKVTPAAGDPDNTLQGVATLDQSKRQARIIVGGGSPQTADVVVKNINPSLFGTTVHATVSEDRASGMTGSAAQPTRVFDTNLNVGADGSVRIPIANGTDHFGDAASTCDATGSRVAGKIGNALKLCGNGDYVNLPDNLLSSLSDFTISAWVNPAANTAWSRVFDFGTGTGDYLFLTLNANGTLRYAITTTGPGGEQQINGAGVLPVNQWSLVTVTQQGNTATLYVNGKAVGNNSNMSLHPSSLGNTNHDWIGRSQYADPSLNGSVDDLQVYDRALSADEITTLATGQPGSGDVASYRFDEPSGATAVDSSGHGQDGTIEATLPATSAYQIVLSPDAGANSTTTDATWSKSYEAENATMTGTGWNINTEGTISNLAGFATSGNQDVGGLRTGSSTAINFSVDVPSEGDYNLSIVDGSHAHAADVSGPTNVFVRVDGGPSNEVDLPVGYEWVIWNHADTTVHLTAGKHTISLGTTGDNGGATKGDAIIDKIDLSLLSTVRPADVYEAEQAALSGAKTDYAVTGQSGAGAVDLAKNQSTTFWAYSAKDGYADLAFRRKGLGLAGVNVNDEPVLPLPALPGGWAGFSERVYLSAGVNKVVVTGALGLTVLDDLAVRTGSTTAEVSTYQAEAGTVTGTARVDSSFDQADGSVVTGIGNGSANALNLKVHTSRAGRYALTMRYANDEELAATHYNPDLMTQQADIAVNDKQATHVNFGSTFSWNQFFTVTVPITLPRGDSTLNFTASQQYNWDGTTVGVIYSGSNGLGAALRSNSAPNLDEISLAPFQAL
jgi:hypothetical protein